MLGHKVRSTLKALIVQLNVRQPVRVGSAPYSTQVLEVKETTPLRSSLKRSSAFIKEHVQLITLYTGVLGAFVTIVAGYINTQRTIEVNHEKMQRNIEVNHEKVQRIVSDNYAKYLESVLNWAHHADYTSLKDALKEAAARLPPEVSNEVALKKQASKVKEQASEVNAGSQAASDTGP